MDSFKDILQKQVDGLGKDWDAAEKQALAAQANLAERVLWQRARNDDVGPDLRTLKQELRKFARNRKVRPERMVRTAFARFILQIARELNPED